MVESEEFTAISPVDGKPYTMQYFERAVFEYLAKPVSPNEVLAVLKRAFQDHDRRRRLMSPG